MKKLLALALSAAIVGAVPTAMPVQAAATPVPMIYGLPKTETSNFAAGLAVKSDGTMMYVESSVGVRKVSPAGTVSTIVAGAAAPRYFTSAFVSGGGVFVGSNSGVFSSPIDDGNIVYRESNGGGLATTEAANAALGLGNPDGNKFLWGIMSTSTGKVFASTVDVNYELGSCTTALYRMNSSYGFDAARSAVRDLTWNADEGYYDTEKCVSGGSAVDDAGNVYDATSAVGQDGYVIKKWDTNNVVTTIAGTGIKGDGRHGDGGKATDANLGYVFNITPDSKGNIYFYERGYIRRISSTGVLTTIAGKGTHWDTDTPDSWRNYSGDGKAAINAELGGVSSMAAAPNGDLFILTSKTVGENYAYLVRRIDMNPVLAPSSGTQVAIPKKPPTTHSSDVEIAVNGTKVTVGLKTPLKASGRLGTQREIVKYQITLKATKKGVASMSKTVSTSSGKSVKTTVAGSKKNSYTVVVVAIARNGKETSWTGPKVTL